MPVSALVQATLLASMLPLGLGVSQRLQHHRSQHTDCGCQPHCILAQGSAPCRGMRSICWMYPSDVVTVCSSSG